MESASSTLSFTARDGSPPTEDDGSLSVAAGLAKEAALLFQAGKFLDCLKILHQLLQKKPDDPKVRHNIVITEQFQNGCTDPKRLIEALENIKKQSEVHARASGEHLEVSRNNESNRTAGIMGNNNVAHQHLSTSLVYSDEFDTSVVLFNIAVVWFHLHEYSKSFSYLDTLYQNIEPVDEGTALHICHLLLDVALLSHHASRSSDVLSYMEKVFCGNTLTNQVDNATPAQQPSLLASKSTLLPSNSSVSDASNSESGTLEISLTRTLSEEEALEDESLQLLSSLDVSGQKRQRPPGITSNDLQRSQAEESLSAPDLRLKLHLYKVRLMILTRNLKAAKREVKLAMNVARGKDYPTALYLKSQLEYVRGNHHKAIKLLMASGSHTDTGISCMYYNNLGCIYYRLGKKHTSGAFFSKALSNSSLVRKEKSRDLQTISQDKSLMITYNCGVHSLSCGRPFPAARCFQTASRIFYRKPLLWLRISECCLMALEKGLLKSTTSESNRSDIRVDVIGKGKWRQLVLKENGQSDCVGKNDLFPSDGKQPDLSMSLARQCLFNALYLLDSYDEKFPKSGVNSISEESEPNNKNFSGSSSQFNSNGEAKDQNGGNNQNTVSQNSVPDYENICMKQKHMMKQAALANSAYVELALENPLKALSTARSLLKLPNCSKIYLFLGTMYAAEALCLLNRSNEAGEQLLAYISTGDHVELPYKQVDCEEWASVKAVESEELNANSDELLCLMIARPEEARGIFSANCAVNSAIVGDLEQAHHFVMKALTDIPNNPQAILTAIYLDLKHGRTQEALAKLKQHSCVRFLPGSLALDNSC